MAVPKCFVTPSLRNAAAGRLGRAARRLGSAGALALLLSGVLGGPGIAAAQTPSSLSGTWQLSCPVQGRMFLMRSPRQHIRAPRTQK